MLHKQVSQTAAIILDQRLFRKRKYSRPKKLVQMSLWVLMRPLYRKKGSASITNGRKTTTAWVLYYFWIKGDRGGRTTKKPWWTTKNTEERGNPNADLTFEKRNTYWSCWTAEVRRSSLVKTGWCSGLGWCRREGRRRRRSSGAEASRGRRRLEEEKGEMERALGRIYKDERIRVKRENRGA